MAPVVVIVLEIFLSYCPAHAVADASRKGDRRGACPPRKALGEQNAVLWTQGSLAEDLKNHFTDECLASKAVLDLKK